MNKCELCGNVTQDPNAPLCDSCWELKTRIERDIEIARKILDRLDKS